MTTTNLLLFMAVMTSAVMGITAVGWVYFHRWYVDEKTNGRRQIDTQRAALLRDKRRKPD